jgi:bacillithiol disulfide reductase
VLDLVVIGAGPAGLAVAIAAQQAGLACEVLEKGLLVNSIFNFPRNMVFFTTADLLEIGGLPFVTPYEKPTQWEGLKYYRRVAETYGLHVSLGHEVTSLRRADAGFALQVKTSDGNAQRSARNVVIATGYYDHPNLLRVPGEDRPHVHHYYTEPHPYWRQDVVVVGGKNSAAIAALELFRAGARVTLVHRGAQLADSVKYWILPDIENRIREGSIPARFEARVREIGERSVVIERSSGGEELPAQAVFLLTGYRPDASLLREAGVNVDPDTLVPEHDLATLQTNVPGLYVAGATASGRFTSRIFIENGRFHGEAILRSVLSRS